MTASLPEPRLAALRNDIGKISQHPTRPDFGSVGPGRATRYHKASRDDNDPLPLVRECCATGGKVLWVCNTVHRVMDAAAAAEVAGLTPLLYHSRFKYEDRVQRHRDVIAAFKSPGAALAICSQVAEMSLDLSADLLVTGLGSSTCDHSTAGTSQSSGRIGRSDKAVFCRRTRYTTYPTHRPTSTRREHGMNNSR